MESQQESVEPDFVYFYNFCDVAYPQTDFAENEME